MFCKKCGAEIPEGAKFCKSCGEPVPPQNSGAEQSMGPVKKKKMKSPLTVAAMLIALVAIYYMFFFDNTVSDVKNLVFNQYGTEAIGTVADKNLSNVKWSSDKIDDGYYYVTLKGFSPDLTGQISVRFDVSYADDYVYATPNLVSVNGDTYSDLQSVRFIMAVVYGNEDVATNALLWSMIS